VRAVVEDATPLHGLHHFGATAWAAPAGDQPSPLPKITGSGKVC
jgi:hypothetical protein